ncbi:MAG TPA: hypothetical protein VGO11_27830 [Chthoniobacteraceae bacterium]|nr:hypothetical protein [Chthoniobacteraceae bacterium]
MSTPASASCPYPGLRAFFTEERDWYFGREAHVDAMLTRLESNRFLAIVGSSGSGKSSLVFAGLIPALREGQLAGSRTDAQGEAAPWSVVCFHPGNHPLEELAGAIVKEARAPDDPHLAGYVRAALDSGDLIQALATAKLLDPARETLVYADQFEELFRFSEKSSRAAQEEALRLSQLLVAAAGQKEVRLHLLLSMRSEFIGECERFPGLPELVSQSQFLTPRLSRKQLEQSFGGPAQAVGWAVAPDALTALLNDCGNSPDQLPLAQHVLRRMWAHAAADSRELLTLEDYTATGGIRTSMAQHGDEILTSLPKPHGEEVARVLFMALCDQREEGPLVRRVSSREEVEALAGGQPELAAQVITAFAGDDPGFIREDGGALDVRHEAVLRQWPRIAEWRAREVENEEWLHELAAAAEDYENAPLEGELWVGKGLRRTEAWLLKEKPSERWATRHGVKNWDQCLRFLDQCRRRRVTAGLTLIAVIVVVLTVLGFTFVPLWANARKNRLEAVEASRKRLELIKVFAKVADDLSGPITKSAIAALFEEEQQTTQLIAKIYSAAGLKPVGETPDDSTVNPVAPAAVKSPGAAERPAAKVPPDQEDFELLLDARNSVKEAADDLARVTESLSQAAPATGDAAFAEKIKTLQEKAVDVEGRRRALIRRPEAKIAIETSLESLLAVTEQTLAELLDQDSLDLALVKEKDAQLLEATADMEAIEGIRGAAVVLGFENKDDFIAFARREAKIEATLAIARRARASAASGVTLLKWTPEGNSPRRLEMADKVNRIRFITSGVIDPPLIAIASGDGKKGVMRVSKRDGSTLWDSPTWSALTDLSISPKGYKAVVGTNGSTVDVLSWSFNFDGILNMPITRHRDSITDVEFSHGGDRITSASADRTVRVFDSKSLAQLYFSSPALPGIVTSVKFHPKDNLVVSGCDDGGVRLHTIDQPGVQLLGKMGAPARRPEFSADGKLVVAASGDKTVRIWTISPVAEALKLEHTAPVQQATFRPVDEPRGYSVITCASNGELRRIQFSKEGEESPVLLTTGLEPRHPGTVHSVSWSSDGAWLASVGGGEVLVWRWTDQGPVARLQIGGLHRDTSRAEFSPDARWLVTYGGDQVALLWDLSKLGGR